jgi:hypothetical protein
MKQIVRANLTLATLSLIVSGIQAAHADVHWTDHQAFYAFDYVDSQVQYDAYDTVIADRSGDSANVTVSLLGDPSTFVWEGTGAFPGTDVSVTDVTTGSGSASATLTVTGTSILTGVSHYGYLSNVGQGLLTASGASLNFDANPDDLNGGQINIVLPGEWSASAGTSGSGLGFTMTSSNQITDISFAGNLDITNYFTYDSTLDATFFTAQVTPEPGVKALLAGLLLSGMGLVRRRLRRCSR